MADLRALPEDLADRVSDAKEGVVDALLNLTWQRTSGSGPDGETVYGTKPSLRFVSGFLLPRYEETGQQDETSDIHLSTHGLDCQIAAGAQGSLNVSATFSIYVRALPSWAELTKPELELFPNPPLRKELEKAIREAMKERLGTALAEEQAKPEDQRRHRREIQQEIYRALLAEHGVRVSSEAWVADSEEPADEADSDSGQSPAAQDESDAVEEGPARLVAQRGRYIFDNDDAAQQIDIPQKWRRLPVKLEPLSLELSDKEGLQTAVDNWTRQMRSAVAQTVAAWIESDEGRNWAYRQATVRPSNFRTEKNWNAFLDELRKVKPSVADIAPNLDRLLLLVQSDPDLRDPGRRNLRVMLENNGREVAKRKRERFDHAIHQVRLAVDLPLEVHRPLKLDRVEASYRFRDFLCYPALGINCGVTESRAVDRLRLTTTWMPRYQQPRIVPNDINRDSPVAGF
jgi:hypothetical protein